MAPFVPGTGYTVTIPMLTEEQIQALSVGRHMVVRANAGSGKTFVLTLRIAWLLLEHGVPLLNIVAITFTTKAAAEMRARIRKLLLQLRADASVAESYGFTVDHTILSSRADTALQSLGSARISTFHAFASSLVRKHGFDVCVDPASRDLPEREQRLLLHTAMRGAIRSALESDVLTDAHEYLGIESTEAYIRTLMQSGEYLDRVMAWYKGHEDLVGYRLSVVPSAAVGVITTVGNTILDQLYALEAHKEPTGANFCEELSTCVHALETSAKPAFNVARSAVDLISSLFTKTGTGKKRDAPFPQTAELHPLPSVFKNLQQWVAADPEAEAVQAGILRSLLHVASAAEKRYYELKRNIQVLDFDDMMRIAVRLLRDHPNVAGAVRRGIAHLLVDEFQDTNPLQYEFIQLLVPDLDSNTKTQTELFVVGDDKQSIYGFRNADVRLFRKVDKAVGEANSRRGISLAHSLHLNNSYRMTAPLAEKVNAVCNQCFTTESEFDVEYSPLVSALPTSEDTPGSMRLHVIETGTTNSDTDDVEGDSTLPESEVDTVSQHVRSILLGTDRLPILDHGSTTLRLPTTSDIAVLVRDRNTVTTVARSIAAMGIPVQVHGGRAFFSRPEVADIRNLLRVFDDGDDSLALNAVLRSPLFLCSDADLITLTSIKQPGGSLWDAVTVACSNQVVGETLRNACRLLLDLSSQVHTMPVSALIRHALSLSGWHDTLGGDHRRQQMLDNVDKLSDIVRAAEQADGATLHDIIDAISIPDGTDNEAEVSTSQRTSGVQVMTLHAAKGLEFPIVILAGISSPTPANTWISSDELGPTFNVSRPIKPSSDGTRTQAAVGGSYFVNKVIDKLRDTAEVRRLLYVALTRAQFHVLAIVRTKTNSDGVRRCANPLGTMALDAADLLDVFEVPTDSPTAQVEPYREPEPIDLSAAGSATFSRAVVSITELVDDLSPASTTAGYHAREQGIAIHSAIANILMFRETLRHTNPVVQRFLDTRSSWSVIPDDAVVEGEYVATLDGCLVIGRPDVLFTDRNGHINIWDWKVISPSSPEDQQRLLSHYLPQLGGYAWLMMYANSKVDVVHTRLLFVPLATEVLDNWSLTKTFTRADMPQVERAIRSLIATPAA